MRKKVPLLLAAIFVVSATCAQDRIVLRNDNVDEISAKVIEIGETQIKYRKSSNLNGPIYAIDCKDVFFIRYANGEKEVITPYDTPVQDTESIDVAETTTTTTTEPLPTPEQTTSAEDIFFSSSTNNSQSSANSEFASYNEDDNISFSKGSYKLGGQLAYYFPEKQNKGTTDFAMDYLITADYYILNRVFIGAGLGINYHSFSASKYDYGVDIESTSTSLKIPLSIGYSLPIINKKISFELATGPALQYTIAGRQSYQGETTKLSDMDGNINRFGINWDIKATISLWGLGLTFGYSAALTGQSESAAGGAIALGIKYAYEF